MKARKPIYLYEGEGEGNALVLVSEVQNAPKIVLSFSDRKNVFKDEKSKDGVLYAMYDMTAKTGWRAGRDVEEGSLILLWFSLSLSIFKLTANALDLT